jgi:hypothetical protein
MRRTTRRQIAVIEHAHNTITIALILLWAGDDDVTTLCCVVPGDLEPEPGRTADHHHGACTCHASSS